MGRALRFFWNNSGQSQLLYLHVPGIFRCIMFRFSFNWCPGAELAAKEDMENIILNATVKQCSYKSVQAYTKCLQET